KDADLNFMLAMSHINTQQPKAALQFFEVAHHEKPDDLDICFQYGLLCCQLSLFDPAEELLAKVVDKTPHADAQYSLGLLKLVREDDKVQVADHFKQAINVQKDHHLAHQALKKISEEYIFPAVKKMELSSIYDEKYIIGEVERVIFQG